MALGSTQPITGVPGIFPGGKGGRCVGLTTVPPSCDDCLEIWEPQPPGTLRVCPGVYRGCFTLQYTRKFVSVHCTIHSVIIYLTYRRHTTQINVL